MSGNASIGVAIPQHQLDASLWPGEEMAHWGALTQLAIEYAKLQARQRTILFRGQPRQWTLQHSLLRALHRDASEEMALEAEREALKHFKSQAHLHGVAPSRATSATSESVLEWWPLMQHHGAPTRLLDWTASFYVAAYFAAVECPDDDGALLIIDGGIIGPYYDIRSENLDDRMLTAPTSSGLAAFTPRSKTTRLVAQQGYFTVASRPLEPHDELLAASGAILRRLVIPHRIKAEALFHLRTMNIGAHTLFPGMDGLGRSAGELIKSSGRA